MRQPLSVLVRFKKVLCEAYLQVMCITAAWTAANACQQAEHAI